MSKQSISEKVQYRFKIKDFSIVSRIMVATPDMKEIAKGPFYEYTDLVFSCEMYSPELLGISQAKVTISAEPQFEKELLQNVALRSSTIIGEIRITQINVLNAWCYVPQKIQHQSLLAASFDKIKHILIVGDRLINRQANIYDLIVSTYLENP